MRPLCRTLRHLRAALHRLPHATSMPPSELCLQFAALPLAAQMLPLAMLLSSSPHPPAWPGANVLFSVSDTVCVLRVNQGWQRE